jgi:hypothetical protein
MESISAMHIVAKMCSQTMLPNKRAADAAALVEARAVDSKLLRCCSINRVRGHD